VGKWGWRNQELFRVAVVLSPVTRRALRPSKATDDAAFDGLIGDLEPK
jgi:hypothetical protein